MSQVYRIEWVPGSDRLRGTCHCGATGEADDPVSMWEWLLAHPTHPVPPVHPGRLALPGSRPWTA